MAGAQVGLGSATFGSIFVGVFDGEAGFTLDNGSVPEVNIQTDTDTNVTYCPGDSIDYGQFAASIQIAAGVDVSAIVKTSETLTVTLPSGDAYAGSAFLVSGSTPTGVNTKVVAALVFRWEDKPTFTAAP